MRRISINLAVTALTFIIGISAANYWTAGFFQLAEGTAEFKSEVAILKERLEVPEGWELISYSPAFSYYVPPGMKLNDEYYCGYAGIDLQKDSVAVSADVDFDRCLTESYPRPLVGRNVRHSNIDFGGKPARLTTYDFENRSYKSICIPDTGDGKSLRFLVRYRDAESASVAEQILATARFRQ
jgi:hypothetical protein